MKSGSVAAAFGAVEVMRFCDVAAGPDGTNWIRFLVGT